jgi:ATP-binding cassette, subfamily B, bacterial
VRITAFLGPLVGLLAALAAIAILIGASQSLLTKEGGQGDLFAFLLYAALLTRPVGGLANMYGQFQMARGTLARLQAILEMKAEPGYFGKKRIERSPGWLACENVNFSYPGRPKVLTNLSLEIRPGEAVALTGENGVGKSTLIKLLLRFYSPDSGRIALDGTDIRDIQVQDLRRQFGYVPQRPQLFNGSIADNIVFGQLEQDAKALESAIHRAIEIAQADKFIAGLPKGLDTEIGDHGVRLSGGQGQRIALARALLRDPPIYILDEATSMYDLESEAAFVEDCVKALRGRTILIITHRPASLALADRVLYVSREGISEI